MDVATISALAATAAAVGALSVAGVQLYVGHRQSEAALKAADAALMNAQSAGRHTVAEFRQSNWRYNKSPLASCGGRRGQLEFSCECDDSDFGKPPAFDVRDATWLIPTRRRNPQLQRPYGTDLPPDVGRQEAADGRDAECEPRCYRTVYRQ